MPPWEDPNPQRMAPRQAFAQQLGRLYQDLNRQVFRHHYRWFTIWFNPVTWGIVRYRFERTMFLAIGKPWGVLRLPLLPMFFLFQPWLGWAEISYQADLGGGFIVLHPSLGVVIAQGVQAGPDLQLTGGNTLGWKDARQGPFVLGERVRVGAGAQIMGPIELGDDTYVGANAVALDSFEGNGAIAGVPARSLAQR